MSFPFPPPPPPSISIAAIVLNAGLLALALLAAFGLLRSSPDLTKSARRRLWTVAGGLYGTILWAALGIADFRSELAAYFLVVWIIVGSALIASLVVQRRGQHPRIRLVIGWMSGVAALLFLLSPLVSTTKSAARRAECQHRLRALADAFAKPDLTFRGKEFPDRVSTNPAVSWRFHVTTRDDMILPEFDLQQPWDGEINLGLARHAPRPLICPASYRPADRIGRFYTAFAAVSGPQTCFPDGRPITRNRISDGMSHTIVFGEAAGLQIVWTEPRDIDISALPIGVNLPGERSGHSFGTLSSYHPGGAIAAFADGRAQFISEHISPVVLRALLTADGGEPIPDTAY